MSSGEWDLRALKALEEEEQKEFLALSQKSLFEPPSPPAASKLLQQTQQLQQQPKLNYAQLHTHILKLPTINECNLIAAARKRQQQQQQHGSSGGGSGRLKFTRALSLSAHSLTARAGSTGNSSKPKAPSKHKLGPSAKSIGSLSPPQAYSVSPVYTPPPIRRCVTLHHTQPVRKTFKTLQQLEKQKQERKKEAAAAAKLASKSPQLQRVAGTNKTYWKYGANSTAASIIGQRTALQRKQQTAELESNTSDEVGSEEASHQNVERRSSWQPPQQQQQASYADCDDSATETGSCTVPLAADSIEMMRLMLTAATTAVTAQPMSGPAALDYAADLDYLLQATPDVTATGGVKATLTTAAVTITTTTATATAASGNKLSNSQSHNNSFFTLSRYPYKLSAPLDAATAGAVNDETVAYEAFHAMARRKSFSGRAHGTASTLLRGSSLTEPDEGTTSPPPTALTAVANRTLTAATRGGTRKMFKANSMEAATTSHVDGGITEYATTAIVGANGAHCGVGKGMGMQRSTIITNPIVEGIKSTTTSLTATMKANQRQKLLSSSSSSTATAAAAAAGTSTGTKTTATTASNLLSNALAGLHYNEAMHQPHEHYEQQQQQQQQLTPAQQQHIAAMLCQEIVSNNSSCNSPPGLPPTLHGHLIDDELEQHIKHCSCSCNHMGYGNSMDYQADSYLREFRIQNIGIWVVRNLVLNRACVMGFILLTIEHALSCVMYDLSYLKANDTCS